MLLTKQCETMYKVLSMRHHCRLIIAASLTGACDTIVIFIILGASSPFICAHRRLRHDCRLGTFICRLRIKYFDANRVSPNNFEQTLLYRFVVNHTRSFSYIMSTPVLSTLFTSLLLGIRSLKPYISITRYTSLSLDVLFREIDKSSLSPSTH
jgi:hypothetical protein